MGPRKFRGKIRAHDDVMVGFLLAIRTPLAGRTRTLLFSYFLSRKCRLVVSKDRMCAEHRDIHIKVGYCLNRLPALAHIPCTLLLSILQSSKAFLNHPSLIELQNLGHTRSYLVLRTSLGEVSQISVLSATRSQLCVFVNSDPVRQLEPKW